MKTSTFEMKLKWLEAKYDPRHIEYDWQDVKCAIKEQNPLYIFAPGPFDDDSQCAQLAGAGVVFIDFSLLLDLEDPGRKEAVEQCMDWLKSEQKFVLALTEVWDSHGNHPRFEDLMSSCWQTNRLFEWAYAARHLLDVIFECRLAPTEPENIDKSRPNGKPLVTVSRNRRVEQSPKRETKATKKSRLFREGQAQRINNSPELLDKAIALLKLDLRCSNAELGSRLGVSKRSVGALLLLYSCDFKKGRKVFSADFLKQLEARKALLVAEAETRTVGVSQNRPAEETQGAKKNRLRWEGQAQQINDSPELLDKAIALLERDPCWTSDKLGRELGVFTRSAGAWLKLYACDFNFKKAQWVFPENFLKQLMDRKASLVSLRCSSGNTHRCCIAEQESGEHGHRLHPARLVPEYSGAGVRLGAQA